MIWLRVFLHCGTLLSLSLTRDKKHWREFEHDEMEAKNFLSHVANVDCFHAAPAILSQRASQTLCHSCPLQKTQLTFCPNRLLRLSSIMPELSTFLTILIYLHGSPNQFFSHKCLVEVMKWTPQRTECNLSPALIYSQVTVLVPVARIILQSCTVTPVKLVSFRRGYFTNKQVGVRRRERTRRYLQCTKEVICHQITEPYSFSVKN